MGLLSLADRKLFETLAAKHFNEGKYDELLTALEEREKKHAALGHVDKVKHTQQRLHWARTGVWKEVYEKEGPREVINLISSDEDEEVSSPKAGPSKPAARSPARPSARRRRSASPQIVDLTQAASDIDVRMKDGDEDDGEEDDDEADDSAPEGQPRAVSPELFGEGCGPLPTPPGSRSASHEPRKSKRAPRPSTFYGNLVAHPRYETGDAVPHFQQASPVKKQKNRSGKASPVKAKKEEKPIEPIFLTPEVATSVARLFPHTMFRSSVSPAEIDAVIKADEAVLDAVRQDLVRWNEDNHRKKCSPVGNPTKYKLREDRVAGGNWVETFDRASVGDEIVEAGDYVAVAGEKDEPWFARVCYFHRHPHRSVLQVHLHWCTTSRAIHGKAAHPRHLLMRDICGSVDAYTVVRKVEAKVGTNLTVPPSSFFISALHVDNATSPVPAFEGSTPFCERLDIRPCWACEDRLQYAKFHGVDPKDRSAVPLSRWLSSPSSSIPRFRYDGHDYHIGDCVYLLAPKRAQEKPHWNGAQAAFRLAVLEAVDDWDGHDPHDLRPSIKPSTRLRVKPIVRLGHIVAAEPGKRRERDVVVTSETTSGVCVSDLMGTFTIKHGDAPSVEPYEHLDTFWSTRKLDESLDADTENAILSVWATPPRLLQPHAKLKVNLEPRLLPLEKAALPSCAVCRKAQREVEKDEKRYWASMADEDSRPSALSLYSGLDLLGLGLTAGCPELNLKFAIEFDANAAKACRDNHPGVKVFTSSVSDQLELACKAREGGPVGGILDVDVVFGGPPCQEFSRANLHKRRDDPRPLQPFVFLGFLESGRPSFALAENVMGLVTFRREEMGDVFGLICDIALRLGYDVTAVALNASAFGVAQDRRRLFLSLTKRGLPAPAAPEPTHAVSSKHTRIRRRYGDEVDDSTRYDAVTKRAAVHSGPFPAVTVGEALSDPTLFPSFNAYENPVSTAEGLDTNGGTTHVVAGMGPKSEARLRALGFHEEGQAGNWTDFADDPTIRLKKTPTWKNMPVDAWRRVWKDEISTPLLTKIAPQGSNGARIHFAANRCWSIAETLKLQGAPTTLEVFRKASKGKPLTKSDIELAYKLVGNAVAVPVAAAFGHELHKVLRTIVIGAKEPPSPGFFFNLSRSLDIREGAAPAPAKKEVEVLVIDDEDEEDEEMVEPNDAASDDSQNSLERLVDGEEDAEQDGPFRGAVLEVDDIDVEESSEDEVVILSSPKKRRKDVETDTDDEY